MDMVDFALNICSAIYKMAENVKSNKERCQRVTQRIKAMEELVRTIKQRGPSQISVTVKNALKELCITLESAKEMMEKHSRTKPVMKFLKSNSREDKFSEINERLSNNFQVLSGALQIEHGNVLYRVYEMVSAGSLDEEHCIEQASSTSYTAPMPLPNTMPPMPVSSPTAPMPPALVMSSPTAPLPPVLPMSSPTTPMPLPSIMPPMPLSVPRAPIPVHHTMPPMQMSSPSTLMPRPGTMAPTLYSTNIVSKPVFATMPPTVISSTMASKPVVRAIAPVQAPVVRAYLVGNSYYR